MAEVEVFSPAKINVFLAVTGRREDGFHDLTSVVAPLEFGDRLRVSAKKGESGIRITCDDPSIPVGEANLIWRAASAFLDAFQIDASVRVALEKRIPHGAGLGGGSSNAAATLDALSEIFEVDNRGKLSELAARIGSDCPLFLAKRPVLIRGRGEIIDELPKEAVERLVGREVVLFKPSIGISTPLAYKALAASPESYADKSAIEDALLAWISGQIELEALMINSFSPVIERRIPGFALLRERLVSEIGVTALMTGSGSCHFAFAADGLGSRFKEVVQSSFGGDCFYEATRIFCADDGNGP